jgi:hypothetical protein
MGRVLHVRIWRIAVHRRAEAVATFAKLATSRDWRGETPPLATADSRDLFFMEYFRHAELDAARSAPAEPKLSAATFVRLGGDETDALALLFILRELSQAFAARIDIADQENPIAKLRNVSIVEGRLADGRSLEEIMVRRPVFKKLPDGFRIEMFPPRALGFAFGTADGEDGELRSWSFHVHGMRGSAPTFFEAEAEAMRIYNGLRRFD